MIHPKWSTTDPHKRLAKLLKMRAFSLLLLTALLVIALVCQLVLTPGINGYVFAIFEGLSLFTFGLAIAVIYLAIVIAKEIRQGRIYIATHESQGYTAEPQ